MIIDNRLRELRESRHFSQGDIEKRTGLLRCYISRVENNHSVPAVETLEKFARPLEVPMYQLFYDGEEAPELKPLRVAPGLWGSICKDAQLVAQFQLSFSKMAKHDRTLLLHMAKKMVEGKGRPSQ